MSRGGGLEQSQGLAKLTDMPAQSVGVRNGSARTFAEARPLTCRSWSKQTDEYAMTGTLAPVLIAIAVQDGVAADPQALLTHARRSSSHADASWLALRKRGMPRSAGKTNPWRNCACGHQMACVHAAWSFAQSDVPRERWRAAGLVVGSLYEAKNAEPQPALEPPEKPLPTPVQRSAERRGVPGQRVTPRPTEPRAPRAAEHIRYPNAVWLIGASGLAGEGVGTGEPRWGVSVDAATLPLSFNLGGMRAGLGAIVMAQSTWQATSVDGIRFRWHAVSAGALGHYGLTERFGVPGQVCTSAEKWWVSPRAGSGGPQLRKPRGGTT